jgi:D-lactate dehydrogenase (cytochrome)
MWARVDSTFAAALIARLGADRVSTARPALEAASRDESSLPPVLPDAVVWPATTDDVASVLALAADARVPVTPRGAGSSLEGNPIPVHGGIVLDLSRMTRVLALRPDDLQADVEPGLVYDDLNRALRSHGFFFPPSPGGSSDVATIGGMAANDASGIYAVKYGGTRSHVLAATVVTGAGEVVRLGTRCRKTSSGYHLIGLLVGSEGTLGVATELTVALAGLPATRRRGAFVFDGDTAAARAVSDLIRCGVDVAAVEFLDARTLGALNAFGRYGVAERPSLFLEVHGGDSLVRDAWDATETLCREAGGQTIALANDTDPWVIRHQATRAIRAAHPGSATVRADVAVPVSSLPRLVEEAHRRAAERGLSLYTFGHAGIGVVHGLVLERETDTPRWNRAVAFREELIELALRLDGSVSGEHGIGLGNRPFVAAEHGSAVNLMRGIKMVFDPTGILNPGKIL